VSDIRWRDAEYYLNKWEVLPDQKSERRADLYDLRKIARKRAPGRLLFFLGPPTGQMNRSVMKMPPVFLQ
jgi:hypothetical protein